MKKNPSFHTIETDRLILRPTSLLDATFILDLLNTPDWHKFIGDRKVNSEEDAKQYISKFMLPQLEKLGFSSNTVIRKADNKKVGTCSLYDRPGLEGVDLGFAFLPQYYRLGYAYESSKAVIHNARQSHNISTINAITLPSNISSQRLLLKLGFLYIKDTVITGSDEVLQLYTMNA